MIEMFETNFQGVKIKVLRGDITKLKVDAIVNPANSFGYMSGGVALAIKRAGGEEIEKEAVKKAPIEIIAFVLDILSHKKYDKKFGYKSR